MKRAIGLVRVSTDAQDVARQRSDLKRLERQYGLTIIRTLELVGISGTATLSHADVQQVLREVQQPGTDGLACSAVDRLFRPRRGSDFAILNPFQDERKPLWTVRDGLLELWTDEGWERAMNAGTRAGSELREIRRRCMDGKAEKRAEGRNVNGDHCLPDGLKFDKKEGWSYDEAKLALVEKGYRLLFEDRYNLSEICRLVGWGRGGCRTLANPTWRGLRVYPPSGDRSEALEVELPLRPLLTPDEWAQAQALLAKRRTWSKETRDSRFLGAGLLWCQCGRRYYIHCDQRKGKHDEYYCASRFHGGQGCGAKRLSRAVVDPEIVRLVREYLTSSRFLTPIFRRIAEAPRRDTRAERESELAKLEARRTKWIEQYDEDRITKAQFNERMDKVNAALRDVEASMPLEAPPVPDWRSVATGIPRAFANFETQPFESQRETLKNAFKSLPVRDDAIAEVTISGAFLAEMAGTKSAQPLRWRCWSPPPGRESVSPS
jgi:DNA invertase Pin-like site-specific DNA recombinase